MSLPKDLLTEQNAIARLEQQLAELQSGEPDGDLLEMARHRETVEHAAAIVAEKRQAFDARRSAFEAEQEARRQDKLRMERQSRMRAAAGIVATLSAQFEEAIDTLINTANDCGITVAGEGLLPPIPSVKEHSGGGWRFTNLPRQQQQQQTACVPNSGTESLIQ